MKKYLKYITIFLFSSTIMNKQVSQELMPALFIGHGSPTNAIQNNSYTKVWQKLAKNLPKPKTILCISAHWQTAGVSVTAMSKPQTIHDFGGFAKQLYQYQYPADGNAELAQNISNKLKQHKLNVKLDTKWGLDHGTWSILCHMYPKADIPVIQLSLNKQFTPQQHFQLSQYLQYLRKQGILIIGSGGIIHNLVLLDWYNMNSGHQWAIKMKQQSNQYILSHKFNKLINYKQNGNQWIKSINSAQHYLPVLYAIGQYRENQDEISLFNDQLMMGSLSMTGFIVAEKGNKIHQIVRSWGNKKQEL